MSVDRFEPQPVSVLMRNLFPYLARDDLPEFGRPRVLIAGCGTGFQAVAAHYRYLDAGHENEGSVIPIQPGSAAPSTTPTASSDATSQEKPTSPTTPSRASTTSSGPSTQHPKMPRFPNPRRGLPHAPQVLHLICESSASRSGERFLVPRSGLFCYHQARLEESSGECRQRCGLTPGLDPGDGRRPSARQRGCSC